MFRVCGSPKVKERAAHLNLENPNGATGEPTAFHEEKLVD